MTSYIVIDSTHRNRNLNPFPSELTLYSKSCNSSRIEDPVSNAYPIFPESLTMTFLTGNTSTNNVIQGSNVHNNLHNFYIHYYFEIYETSTCLSQFRKIKYYDGMNKVFYLEEPFTIPFQNVPYRIRKEQPVIQFSPSYNAANSPTIIIPSIFLDKRCVWEKYYLLITNTTDAGKIINITHYDSTTNILSLKEAITFDVNTCMEIICTNYDNFVSFEWSVNQVVFNQPICYDISLLNVTIPNVNLLCGYGGRLSNYPYLWVAFYAINNYSNENYYTNMPITKTKLFKAILTDTSGILNSSFIKLSGSGMVQTIKLIPNGTYKFSIYLPNDELLIYESDSFSLLPPNPLLQISATFALRPSNI